MVYELYWVLKGTLEKDERESCWREEEEEKDRTHKKWQWMETTTDPICFVSKKGGNDSSPSPQHNIL